MNQTGPREFFRPGVQIPVSVTLEESVMLDAFTRGTSDIPEGFSRIGQGEVGGKASSLINISGVIEKHFPDDGRFDFKVYIPGFTVISSEYFDFFMKMNDLWEIALADMSDERKLHHFLKTELPVQLLGDLRSIVQHAHFPLAVRSSSLLEDSLDSPFAGVYATKMISNNHSNIDFRYKKLCEAVRYIYASTFFKQASAYRSAQNIKHESEKMCVMIQEVVGNLHSDRFYPEISGVLRSFNYYPSGDNNPENGVAMLALGLGKTIVDGGVCWTYCPESPEKGLPYNSIDDMMKNTQRGFWAVNMNPNIDYDPMRENEFLQSFSLEDSEYDNTIHRLASTYDQASQRIVLGTGRKGPRIIDFAPILSAEVVELNKVIKEVITMCRDFAGEHVEIEFAAAFGKKPRLGILQVRPMKVMENQVDISDAEFDSPDVLVRSESILGNGIYDNIQDILYVSRDGFDMKNSNEILNEVEEFNSLMVRSGTRYVLMGFGRWGSSDPWLGVGVNWSQISNVSVIVEVNLPDKIIDFSQGSHFFHNLVSQNVGYMSVPHFDAKGVNWELLEQQADVVSGKYVKHVKFKKNLNVKLDGRRIKGVIAR